MRGIVFISTLILGGVMCASNIMASGGQGADNLPSLKCGVEYTTEWQSDFEGGYQWLNLLKLSADLPLSADLSLQAATISAANTGEQPLVEDLLTYSNIEAGNIPLTLARLGLALNIRDAELFVGINNVNEDYFTSDLTSFFTNSSCGISPTISCNFDIANYPLASWCLHYLQRVGDFTLQTSLYPGRGYSRLLGHDNQFGLDIRRDGIFSISSIDYKSHGINCILGVALHHGVCIGDEASEPLGMPQTPSQRMSVTPWLLTEIRLSDRLGLLAQGSLSTVDRGCKNYLGMGAIYRAGSLEPGLYIDRAGFSGVSEYTMELACRILSIAEGVHLQPALHLISTDLHSPRCVGMLRLALSL